MSIIEVVPNDNEKEREDRYGRVRVSRRRTWLVIVDDEVASEYRTRKEATSAALRHASFSKEGSHS